MLSPTAPNDYTEVDEVVTFSAGNQGPMSVRVPIIDDTDVEADETLTVSISIEAGFSNLASTADPRQATITIEDNDGMCSLGYLIVVENDSLINYYCRTYHFISFSLQLLCSMSLFKRTLSLKVLVVLLSSFLPDLLYQKQ